MEINKRLILNKTPKDMPYGSMSCAKNMMVDDTGSFLTNDIGFKESFVCPAGEKIVGVIPCNKEIVIFTHNETSGVSHIYRKKNNELAVEAGASNHRVKWTHTPGTKISGSYTYNYKGQLIIAFCEYSDDNTTNLPMKSINLDAFDHHYSYDIEEEIPIYDSKGYIVANGSLVCGVYTFFVRFKIDAYNYTKWFQVTGDINITQPSLSKKYVHTYLTPYSTSNNVVHTTQGAFTVNTNKISNKSIVVSLGFSATDIKLLQLGYIIKRNSEIVGRLQGEYSIPSSDTLNMTVSNNKYLEDISVDSLLENPHQFFNVKNIINYNNRLYIANYKEYPVVNYGSTALQTQIDVSAPSRSRSLSATRSVISGEQSNKTNLIWNIALQVYQHSYLRGFPWENTTTVNLSSILTDGDGYVSDVEGFISQIATVLKSLYSVTTTPDEWGTSTLNYYWFLQKPNDNTKEGAICIAKYINNNTYAWPPSWNWNFNIPEYKVKIIAASGATPASIVVEYNGSTWNLLEDGPYGVTNGLTDATGTKSTVLVFYHTGGAIETDRWRYGNGYEEESSPTWQNWNPGQGTYMNHDIHITISTISNNAGQNNGGNDTPNPGGDDPTGGEVATDSSGANNRTLHPYQTYNFFIHYIRKDGSCTLGFPISAEFKTYALASGANVIIPRFTAVNPDTSQFVGYFITYEDVESTVDCVYITISNATKKLLMFTNPQYLFDIDTIRGTKIKVDGVDYTINQDALTYIESRLTYNHIEHKGDLGEFNFNVTNKVAYVLKDILNLYINKTKTLYRLTKNIYNFTTPIGTNEYLPAYYTNSVIISYSDKETEDTAFGFIIDPTANYVVGFNSVNGAELGGNTTYNCIIEPPSLYANIPLSAMNIKQDYEQGAVVLTYHVGDKKDGDLVERTDTFVNVLVSPDKLHDLLELASCYSQKPSKSFTNFNEDNIYTFDKTIYRSDVVSDESLINSFRHFAINNYKNIFENKGKIVNLVGIGLYFLVHTEYSLYVFDRTPKLTAKSQLDIPDTFDIDYQDVMPSNEGFGGLADKEEAILTKNGYIWYDRVNKIIFKYENGKVSILSIDINNFLKYLDVLKIRFAEDILNNRLIICIYTNVIVQAENEITHELENTNETKIVTLSYSFNTNSFISIHDYKFTNNYRTYEISYLFDENSPTKLFEFDNNSTPVNYPTELAINEDYYFPYYGRRLTDPIEITTKSYVDIIFNKNYFDVKNVESVRYLLSIIEEPINIYKITEEKLDRLFSGDEIRIYTDSTDTGDLVAQIDKDNVNALNAYKLPFYDKGAWNFNYFRNRITEALKGQELSDNKTFKEYDPNTGTYVTKEVPLDKLKEANNYVQTTDMASPSDFRSLIYGKYIVVRFIFNNNHKVKLDGVDIITNKY